jgi:hypothetical protein
MVIGGLILEGGVLLFRGEQPKFPRHVVGASFGLRINEPNARYRHRSADVSIPFRINGQGMRADHDFVYDKAPGRKRIVSLGDSFTLGYEVDAEQCFSSVLERELRAQGRDVEVLNCGVSGYSNAEELLYLERELYKYHPDVILVSFYGNDLADNVRTGLFRLEGDRLVEGASGYVPLGGVANALNTNPALSWLSERSNAFVLVKELATNVLKRRAFESNVEEAEGASEDRQAVQAQRLAAAIFERMLESTTRNGVPLVIQSIPSYREPPPRLVERFPLAEFEVQRPNLHFLAAKDVLDPLVADTLLYWKRSHGHWTPVAHETAGKALAELMLRNDLP